MLNPDSQPPHFAVSPLDPSPDYDRYRARARYERTRAINRTLSRAWNLLARSKARQRRDAAFWTA